jgi:predicted transcriptional regulator YdeE
MFKSFLLICSIATSLMIQAEPIQTSGEIENSMPYKMEKQEKKLVMGIMIRTDNEQCLKDMPQLWEKLFKEKILEKIPHKVNKTILAVYTDYEDDYTKPYSYIVGCEVSTLDNIPEGLVGIIVPPSLYAVYTTAGPYPQGLSNTWQTIWKTPLKRAYTSDFEVYSHDFNPQTKPEVKIYIAL